MTKRAKVKMTGETCSKCHKPLEIGDRVIYTVPMHEYCNPGAFAALPVAQTVEQVRLNALVALEDALVTMAAQSTNGVGAELEKHFDRYQKVKAIALRPGTPGEERAALRLALIEAVKLVF